MSLAETCFSVDYFHQHGQQMNHTTRLKWLRTACKLLVWWLIEGEQAHRVGSAQEAAEESKEEGKLRGVMLELHTKATAMIQAEGQAMKWPALHGFHARRLQLVPK